jgi:hypothetical protein
VVTWNLEFGYELAALLAALRRLEQGATDRGFRGLT